MGLERIADGPHHATWADILSRLVERGQPAVVKMLDGMPAFPGEIPEETCQEVRLGFPAGMVTLRRTTAGVSCIVWGSADADLLAARDACVESCVG